MSLRNTFVTPDNNMFYPRRISRIFILVTVIIIPQVIMFVINVTTTRPITVVEKAANVAYPIQLIGILWIIIIENFKCIKIYSDRLRIEMLPPRKFQKRLEIYWENVHQVQEYRLPVAGSIFIIRSKDGHFAGCIWITSWKNSERLKNTIIQAALLNGGFFIPWYTSLLTIPRRLGKLVLQLFKWLKGQFMPL